MKTLVKRAGIMALAALVVSVSAVAAGSDCLPYISSSSKDLPLSGFLTGEKTVTTTTNTRLGSTWSYRYFGGTYSYSTSMQETYNVGLYRMSDGTLQQVRCDTYMYV